MKDIQQQDFVVTCGFDEEVVISGAYAGIVDGALVFLDADDGMIEFFGAGYWKRVRVKERM